MRLITHDLLAREVTAWHQQGLIDRSLLETLLPRYETRSRFLSVLLKWLGLFAIFLLGLAVLAFIAMASDSALLAAGLLAAVGGGLWYFGLQFATDPHQTRPFTGSVLITASLAAAFGVFMLLQIALLGEEYAEGNIPLFLLFTGALAILTAYCYHLRWPLLLGLLMFFHGLGAWHTYGGGGAYFADIQDPKWMAVIALLTMGLGLWHERRLEISALRRCVGFGALYLIFGLLYLNLSLWFLTLPRGPLDWVLIFTAASIAQIVVGARLHDARFTGFGIVFLAIDLYTRYYEHFWDQLSLGIFFLLGGLLAMAFGYACERWSHATASESQA